MFGLLTPVRSWKVCCAAPKPGVFVTAPYSTPVIVGISTPLSRWMIYAVRQPKSTMPTASMFSFKPPLPNDEKKLGPTCRPIE